MIVVGITIIQQYEIHQHVTFGRVENKGIFAHIHSNGSAKLLRRHQTASYHVYIFSSGFAGLPCLECAVGGRLLAVPGRLGVRCSFFFPFVSKRLLTLLSFAHLSLSFASLAAISSSSSSSSSLSGVSITACSSSVCFLLREGVPGNDAAGRWNRVRRVLFSASWRKYALFLSVCARTSQAALVSFVLAPGFCCVVAFLQGQKNRCSRIGSRWSMGAGTMISFVVSLTSLLLNIHNPNLRKHVAQVAVLGTAPIFGCLRPCQPIRANARATSLGVEGFVLGGSGSVKKVGGSWD